MTGHVYQVEEIDAQDVQAGYTIWYEGGWRDVVKAGPTTIPDAVYFEYHLDGSYDPWVSYAREEFSLLRRI